LSTPWMHAYPETIMCKFGRDLIICLGQEAIFVQRFSCQHKIARIMWPLTLTLTLSTPWMQAYVLTIVCKFGHDRAICLREEIFVPAQKCPCHMTFDLDLDLEHILDARWPGVHLVKVWWRSGHLPARRSDLRKSLQTDRQTDRWTDRRRTFRHCISSFLEWANSSVLGPDIVYFIRNRFWLHWQQDSDHYRIWFGDDTQIFDACPPSNVDAFCQTSTVR